VPQLRSPSTSLFWQSDGPQPHYLNIHFFKLVRIVGLRLYLDFEADESYTPTRIVFLAGSGGNDLVEWGEMKLEQPQGWVWADFSGVGEAEGEEDEDASSDDSMPDLTTRNYTRNREQNHDDSEIENTRPEPAGGADAEDTMNIDVPRPALPRHFQHTPTAIPNAFPGQNQNQNLQQNLTPSLHRTHPRRPLHNLTPNSSPRIASPEARNANLPVLRAHLVQIKILENHQNGKDTHLRGLQIFAKENESEATREVHMPAAGRKSMGRKTGDAGGMLAGMGGTGSGLRGLTTSSWDVEPSIR
jgi:anaphase-promoting complex subunit 10